MTVALLAPFAVQKFFDANGLPLVNGQLFVYSAGTSTKRASYIDSTGTTPNTNPVIANARGECNVWLLPNIGYKLVLSPANDTDPPTNPIWTVDQIVNSQLITLYGGVDTGIVNAYVLNFTANFSAYVDGITLIWIPSHSNTGASTVNVNNLGPVNIINYDGSVVYNDEIQANQPVQMTYKGGSFIITSLTNSTGLFNATFATGWTTTPSVSLFYFTQGPIVRIYTSNSLTATSNANTATITGVPVRLIPKTTSSGISCPCRLIDNGVQKGGWAYLDGTGKITLGLGFDSVGGGFTGAGTKGLDVAWSISYWI